MQSGPSVHVTRSNRLLPLLVSPLLPKVGVPFLSTVWGSCPGFVFEHFVMPISASIHTELYPTRISSALRTTLSRTYREIVTVKVQACQAYHDLQKQPLQGSPNDNISLHPPTGTLTADGKRTASAADGGRGQDRALEAASMGAAAKAVLLRGVIVIAGSLRTGAVQHAGHRRGQQPCGGCRGAG